jgi:outer membrane protein insertion porin family
MENNNMYEAYRSKGYINVKIIPFIDKDRLNGKANIKYLVQENEIVSISNIYIDTDNFVKNKRLQNEIAFKPGNIFTYKKLYKSIFNLYNHKFIESVGYILVQTDIPNSFDIVFSFIERKPNIFNLGLGYSSKPKRLITSIQLENSNLFDLGQTLTLCYNLNYLGYEYNVHFMDPWVFNQNLSLDLNLLRTKTQVNNLNYKNTMNFLIELGTKLSDDIRIFLGYQTNNYYASNINIQTLPIMSSTQSKSLASPKTPFRIPSVLIRLIYDSRDNRHKPSKGIVHSFTMHVANRALGGQLSFIRKVFKTSFYCPLLFKMISSFNFEYGTISTNDETRKKLPFYELFYLGDFENIKGHGDNIHNYGCHKYMFNIENKFPLISINPTNELQGILFYDVGGIWKNPKEINLKFGNKTYNLHSSIGYGLQFGFKLLCMKISFVYNLYYDKYTPKRQIHINLFNSM